MGEPGVAGGHTEGDGGSKLAREETHRLVPAVEHAHPRPVEFLLGLASPAGHAGALEAGHAGGRIYNKNIVCRGQLSAFPSI